VANVPGQGRHVTWWPSETGLGGQGPESLRESSIVIAIRNRREARQSARRHSQSET